jgi:hypothetical protein
MNKFAEPLPYADPKAAPRKVLRSPTARRGLDSRLFIEKLNSPMLRNGASPIESGAGTALLRFLRFDVNGLELVSISIGDDQSPFLAGP